MNVRTRRLAMIALVMLVLTGCSPAVDANQTPEPIAGAIELAMSQTCDEGSDAQCVSVNDGYVLQPAAFERATVEQASVADNAGQNAVTVTFTEEGAAIIAALTEQASDAGSDARLVMKIGDEIRAAVEVMQPITDNSVMIALAPDDSAQDVVDLITNG